MIKNAHASVKKLEPNELFLFGNQIEKVAKQFKDSTEVRVFSHSFLGLMVLSIVEPVQNSLRSRKPRMRKYQRQFLSS